MTALRNLLRSPRMTLGAGGVTLLLLLATLLLLPGSKTVSGLIPVPREEPPPPPFTLVDLSGRDHALADHRGQVVMVNFWATWCPPCRAEMPALERLWRTLKDQGFVLLALNVEEGLDRVLPFVKEQGLTFPVLLDRDGAVARSWRARGLPATYILDPSGRVRYQAVGGRSWDDPEMVELLQGLARE